MQFRLLGTLEVASGGVAIQCGPPKQRALLAYLMLRANEAVGRDRLVDALWGDDPPASAANALQVQVHGLRKLLGRERLETRGNAYLLRVEPGELDLERFEELVREARAEADPAARADLLASALALWRGSPLSDLADVPFVGPERSRLEEEHVAAVELQVEADLALGRDEGLVARLEALVAAHPYRERLRAQLMLALYRAGRQADALAAFQQARRELVEELGIDPGPGLQELERAILRQDPALVVEPESVRARRRLPAPATALIGRHLEVAGVCALLGGDARLVTLTGPGGTGKTRVALQAAFDLADRFADGVVFVGLAALRDSELVLAEIASALDVTDGRDPHAAVAAHLSDRSALLVIDNFEQVDDAAPALAALLGEAPGLKLLVTSRRPLRIYGEHEFAIAPLALDAEAVPLFLERARAAGRPLQASEDVREICRRLDCLPLALELAATRARELAPAEMRSLLTGRLGLATEGPRDLPPRQRTLRATIEWSCELLDPEERRLFAALAVFAGGWTAEAAAAVCGGDPRALAALVEKSMLVRSGARFTMLETIREYALERLRADLDEAELLRLHAEHFAELAVDAKAELDGPSASDALERLDAEQDNLRAALTWSLAHHPAGYLRLVDALYLFWYVRGHYREGLRWYERAGTVAGDDPAAHADVLKRVAALAYACREFARARSLIAEALPVYKGLDDKPNVVRALTLLGLIATNEGRPDEAVPLLEESAALARGAGDEHVHFMALANLGYGALTAGDLERAHAASLEAVELYRGRPEESNPSALGAALGNLGVAALLQGRPEEGRARLVESVGVRKSIRDAFGLASAFTGLAAFAAGAGAFTRAALLLGAADAVLERTDAELEPVDARLYDEAATASRSGLGDDAFRRAHAEGRALGLDEAADLAVEPG